jgi:hypothetical protein
MCAPLPCHLKFEGAVGQGWVLDYDIGNKGEGNKGDATLKNKMTDEQ